MENYKELSNKLLVDYNKCKNLEWFNICTGKWFTKNKNIHLNGCYKGIELYDVYTYYSRRKQNAFEYCENLVYDFIKYYNMEVVSKGIISNNCMIFTYGAKLCNSCVIIEIYITKTYNYIKVYENRI